MTGTAVSPLRLAWCSIDHHLFRAYNLTSREFQVVKEAAAIRCSLQGPQAGQLFLAMG